MKVSIDQMDQFDAKACFICGKFLLNNSSKDLAYQETHTGRAVKAHPERYYLFSCPSCGKVAHKRCWYDHGEKKSRKGWFGRKEWRLVCPSCNTGHSPIRDYRLDWKSGYQVPGYPDSELLELHTSEVIAWKAGSMFRRVGKAINDFFVAVGLRSLTDSETSSVARAAEKIGKTLREVAQRVFKLEIPPERRSEIAALKCQNCAAPLPLPEPPETAVVCSHCGTAHLLPE